MAVLWVDLARSHEILPVPGGECLNFTNCLLLGRILPDADAGAVHLSILDDDFSKGVFNHKVISLLFRCLIYRKDVRSGSNIKLSVDCGFILIVEKIFINKKLQIRV